MTDKDQDKNSIQTTPARSNPEATTKAGAKTSPPPATKTGGGKGIAVFALLIALVAGGASGYLWYLWDKEKRADAALLESRLDQALTKVAADRDTELKELQSELQAQQAALNELKGHSEVYRADIQTLKDASQAQIGNTKALQGDIQNLKGAVETQKGAHEIQRTDIGSVQSDIRGLQQTIQSVQSGFQTVKSSLETHGGDLQVRQKEIQALQDETQALQSNLQALGDKVVKLNQDQDKVIGDLGSQIDNLQLGQHGLLKALDTVKEVAAQGGDVNAFVLSEVEYLLRLANHKLKLQQDVSAALSALTVAEERLGSVKENAFRAVQQMIGENIASLRGIEMPDRSALAHKIAEMETRVEELPLLNDLMLAELKDRVKPNIEANAQTSDAEGEWWEQLSGTALGHLKDMVRVRNERASGPPLIAVEEEYFLYQNLRLQLEAMRLALLSGDATNYQDSNGLARTWMQTYFDTNDEGVKAFMSELQALQAVKFNPYIPDISGTLKAFEDVMARRSPVRSVATPAVTGAASGSGDAQAEEAKP